ncbi:RDD family protein [Actinotalea sp.]|uniref:RDD family protein n=1 Tax=Actinotalea sp. TaxID=1872145 RepID=UPI003561C88C
MSNDQPGTGQPSWQPSEGAPPPYGQQSGGDPYGQPPAAAPYGQAPAYGQSFPAAPAYGAGGYSQGYAGPELAHWGLRVGASVIDNIIAGIPYFIGVVISTSTASISEDGTTLTGGAPLAVAVGGLLSFALWIWNRGVKQGGTGQSVGKKVLGIRLLKEADGQPVGVGMALVRDIVHIVDGFFYLGYLWPLWDAKKQTFADKILTTLVVKG